MLNPGAYCPAASEEGERIMGGLYAQELNAKYEVSLLVSPLLQHLENIKAIF